MNALEGFQANRSTVGSPRPHYGLELVDVGHGAVDLAVQRLHGVLDPGELAAERGVRVVHLDRQVVVALDGTLVAVDHTVHVALQVGEVLAELCDVHGLQAVHNVLQALRLHLFVAGLGRDLVLERSEVMLQLVQGL